MKELGYESLSNQNLEEQFRQGLITVGDAFGGYGDLLSRASMLALTNHEREFKPLPTFRVVDDTVEVALNPESLELWTNAFQDAPDLTNEEITKIYFAGVASVVDLRFLSIAARNERKLEGNRGFIEKAIGRAAAVSSGCFDRGQLEMHAVELEDFTGLSGAKQMVKDLSDKDLQEINLLRHAIGSAFFALEYSPEKVAAIKGQVRQNLHIEVKRYEDALLSFLDFITEPQKYAKLQSQQERIRRLCFAHLLVAASTPMGY